jgi:hypothetical protein
VLTAVVAFPFWLHSLFWSKKETAWSYAIGSIPCISSWNSYL